MTYGVVVGAEYFPVQKFNIGGEVAFSYVKFGNPDVSYQDNLPQTSTTTSTRHSQTHASYCDGTFYRKVVL